MTPFRSVSCIYKNLFSLRRNRPFQENVVVPIAILPSYTVVTLFCFYGWSSRFIRGSWEFYLPYSLQC